MPFTAHTLALPFALLLAACQVRVQSTQSTALCCAVSGSALHGCPFDARVGPTDVAGAIAHGMDMVAVTVKVWYDSCNL